MKFIYSLIVVLLCSSVLKAQREDVYEYPVGTGFAGFYNITTLQNFDDKTADMRLDYKMTFGYSGGVERFSYFSNNFGWGLMFNYAGVNQDYTGLDTFTKHTFSMNTDMVYYKMNVLMHYKSFAIYKPESRTRFVSYFGPYIAYLNSVSDHIERHDPANNNALVFSSTTSNNVSTFYNSSAKVVYEKPLYRQIDYGGSLALGFETFLSKKRRLSVALMARADVGASNVENTDPQIATDQNGNPLTPKAQNPWDGTYFKYSPLTTNPMLVLPTPNLWSRARTNIFSYGAGLTVRYYLYPEKKKFLNIFTIR